VGENLEVVWVEFSFFNFMLESFGVVKGMHGRHACMHVSKVETSV